MTILSNAQIQDVVRALPGWRYENGSLIQEHVYADFVQAFAFVTRLALMAEREGHHPDIDIRYNKVRVGLVSHDAGGVTERDAAMATEIQKLSA